MVWDLNSTFYRTILVRTGQGLGRGCETPARRTRREKFPAPRQEGFAAAGNLREQLLGSAESPRVFQENGT